MKDLRDFQIDIFRLSEKLHEFDFDVDSKLFRSHENSLIEKGEGKCHLKLAKTATMMTLHFKIDMVVELVCDRSLDRFNYPLNVEEEIIIKFGDDNYSLSEDVMVIKSETPSLNIGDFIYEFVSLAVPMKKLHPRYQDDDDEQADVIYTSQTGTSDDDESTEQIDPRWEALKKLKENK